MVVCLCPDRGLFARINTKGWRPGSVPIARSGHAFLHHDSHIECGAIFELDDYVIDQSLDPPAKGVTGRIANEQIGVLIAAIRAAQALRDEDRDAIVATLEAI